jgi:four helix bundle protein
MNRAPSKSFEDLIVWQKAHALTLATYRITESFPKTEQFGLTSQMRRASTSIAANIAEGYRKRSANDKARFMNISEGSLDELKYFFILSRDLSYISVDTQIELELQCNEVSRLLHAYSKALRNNSNS